MLCLLILALSACGVAPYRPAAPETVPFQTRATLKTTGAFDVRAAVPTQEEANNLFGISLEKRGIQPVWLEVTNRNASWAWVAFHSIDPEYFPPHEVAYMYRKQFSRQGWRDMEEHLLDLALPRHIPPGETRSGFVFTHQDPGTKTFNVDVFQIDPERNNERFTFFIEVADFRPDYREVVFNELYPPEQITETDSTGLRDWLQDSPCCSTNEAAEGNGRPVHIVVVAGATDLLQALLRAGWDETAYERDASYIEAADYLFGRPPDSIFRKSRGASSDRNELSLWAAPVRVEGRPVWLAQIKHAVGRRFKLGDLLLGATLDPDADEGRNFFLQNLWYAQALEKLAWSASTRAASAEDPQLDARGNPWFSDGLRVVVWVSGDVYSMVDTERLDWDAEGPGGRP